MSNKNGVIEAMQFLVVPILKKDKELVKLLLDQAHLWNYELFL